LCPRAPRNAVREERGGKCRLSGRRRRAARPGAGVGIRFAPRARLVRGTLGALSRPTRVVRAADSLPQARNGALRPARRTSRSGDENGRRASCHGRRRLGACRAVRLFRGRADGVPVRSHLPRAELWARALRDVCEARRSRRRLSVVRDDRGATRGRGGDRAELGHRGRSRHDDSERRPGSRLSPRSRRTSA
jgi:hypothetical protein